MEEIQQDGQQKHNGNEKFEIKEKIYERKSEINGFSEDGTVCIGRRYKAFYVCSVGIGGTS